MNTVDRKARAIAMALLLLGGGVAMGALAARLTTDSLVWRAPPRFAATGEAAVIEVDHAQAGKSWARKAFDGGLRQCPNMNPEFLAACQAEMKALAARPALPAGSYGGPLLVTRLEPSRDDRAWAGYDRPEAPPPPRLRDADYDLEDEPIFPPEPVYEPTPDNYPAAPDEK